MIGTQQALEALRATVAKYGAETTYRDRMPGWQPSGGGTGPCRYIHEGQPSCIVGVALIEGCGLDPALFDGAVNSKRIEVLITIPYGMSLNYQGILAAHVTRDAGDVLQEAQRVQDLGGTWGAALAAAERYALVSA